MGRKTEHYSIATVSSSDKRKCLAIFGREKENDKTKELSIKVFDQLLQAYLGYEKTTTRPKSLGLIRSGYCTSSHGDLYVYGGIDVDGSTFYGDLHKLTIDDKDDMTEYWYWKLIPTCSTDRPMKKGGCGMVCFDEMIVIMAGFGVPTGISQKDAQFVPNGKDKKSGSGWTNEIHVVDIKTGVWTCPDIKGTRPPPLSFCTLTKVRDKEALMYGGHDGCRGCKTNDIYIVKFINSTELQIARLCEEKLWPKARSDHAACCLDFGSNHPYILMTGGVDGKEQILNDAWLFSVPHKKWIEVLFPNGILPPIRNHSLVVVNLSPTQNAVTQFGGCTSNAGDTDHPKIAKETILHFTCFKKETSSDSLQTSHVAPEPDQSTITETEAESSESSESNEFEIILEDESNYEETCTWRIRFTSSKHIGNSKDESLRKFINEVLDVANNSKLFEKENLKLCDEIKSLKEAQKTLQEQKDAAECERDQAMDSSKDLKIKLDAAKKIIEEVNKKCYDQSEELQTKILDLHEEKKRNECIQKEKRLAERDAEGRENTLKSQMADLEKKLLLIEEDLHEEKKRNECIQKEKRLAERDAEGRENTLKSQMADLEKKLLLVEEDLHEEKKRNECIQKEKRLAERDAEGRENTLKSQMADLEKELLLVEEDLHEEKKRNKCIQKEKRLAERDAEERENTLKSQMADLEKKLLLAEEDLHGERKRNECIQKVKRLAERGAERRENTLKGQMADLEKKLLLAEEHVQEKMQLAAVKDGEIITLKSQVDELTKNLRHAEECMQEKIQLADVKDEEKITLKSQVDELTEKLRNAKEDESNTIHKNLSKTGLKPLCYCMNIILLSLVLLMIITPFLMLTPTFSEYLDLSICCHDSPTLPVLQRYPAINETTINFLERIGPSIDGFAISLLQDRDGTILENIHSDVQGVDNIARQVFRKWLNGQGMKPITWTTVAKCLEYSDLKVLAEKINNNCAVSC